MSDTGTESAPIQSDLTQMPAGSTKSSGVGSESKLKRYGDNHHISPDHEKLVKWVMGKCVFKGEWGEEETNMVRDFVELSGCRKLVLCEDNESEALCVYSDSVPPLERSRKFQFLLKTVPSGLALTMENIGEYILHGVISGKESMDSLVKVMQGMYVPTFLGNRTWPDGVRKEFAGQLHRFMANLVDATNQKKGITILYLPEENLSIPVRAAKDKDLVQRLESTLLHWTKQIKEVVSGSDNAQQLEASGILEEIRHWGRRDKDLSGIKEQLEQARLKEILHVLHIAKSSYLTNFKTLSAMIHKGSYEAKSNLKFLSPLRRPCEMVAKSFPNKIPSILPQILNLIRMISTLSPHYSSQEKITNLLLKVSHQIIVQCNKNIDLDLLFGGDVLASISALQENIECCSLWRRIYDETIFRIRNSPDAKKWDEYDHGTIFAQIEAFKKRCYDLTEVCEGQLQFARRYNPSLGVARAPIPYFGGTSGRTIGKSLYEIEDTFEKHLSKLKNLEYDILNVKSTDWHDDYNTFKDGMSDLEVMMTNVITSAWEGISTVKGGVELLEAFYQIARRTTMKQSLAVKVSAIWQMFGKELKRVKDCFEKDKNMNTMHSTSCAPIRRYSRVCGSAMWARGLLERIRQDMDVLQRNAQWLPRVIESSEALKAFKSLESVLVTYVTNGCFDKWEQQIRDDEKQIPQEERLNKRLLQKSEGTVTHETLGKSHLLVRDPAGRLECVFDKTMIQVDNDVYFWNVFNDVYTTDAVSIPHQARTIHASQQRLRTIRDQVMQVVREYNITKEYLTDDEEKMFEYHLSKLDRYIALGVHKLTWAKKEYIKKFVMDSKEMCRALFETVSTFKEYNKKIDAICTSIENTLLVQVTPNKVYFDEEFEQAQARHHSKVRKLFKQCHTTIQETLEKSFSFFENVPLGSVLKEWGKYVRKVDKRLLSALRKSVISSLSVISNCINGNPKLSDKEIQPTFTLSVRLEDTRVVFEPTMDSLIRTIKKVERSVVRCVSVITKMESTIQFVVPKRATFVQWDDVDQKGGNETDTFYEDIQEDNVPRQLMSRTEFGMSETRKKMLTYTKRYDQHAEIWNIDKKKYVLEWGAGKPKLTEFVTKIKRKQNMQNFFQNLEPICDVGFIRLDSHPIKLALIQHCVEWQKEFTTLLHDFARKDLRELQDYFVHHSASLQEDPEDLKELKMKTDLLDRVNEDKRSIQDRFEPIDSQYRTLEKFGESIQDDEKEMLDNLRPNWGNFLDMLSATEERMKRVKANFKKSLEESQLQYARNVVQMRKRFTESGPFDAKVRAGEEPDIKRAKDFIEEQKRKMEEMRKRSEQMESGLQLFSVERINYPELKDNASEIKLLEKLWGQYENWFRHYNSWKRIEFVKLVPEKLDQFSRLNLSKLKKLFQQHKKMQSWQAWYTLEETIKQFKKTIGPINNLRNPAIKPRHWDALKNEIGIVDFDPYDKNFTLGTVLSLGLHKHDNTVAHLAMVAMKELSMEKNLGQIEETWNETEIEVIPYKKGFNKIVGVDTLNDVLENHQLQLSTMKNSPYYSTFAAQINLWIRILNEIVECMDAALSVQQQWIYLESIFMGSDHIRRQLPKETSLFKAVHKGWIAVMERVVFVKNAQDVFTESGLLTRLFGFIESLESIQKSLATFLASKRKSFSRFYFLSDQDLLEILANAKNPKAVQQHINKLFVGIKDIVLKENEDHPKKFDATAIRSKDGEQVQLYSLQLIDGEVESWLSDIDKGAKETLRVLTKLSLQKLHRNKKKAHAPEVLNDWIERFPGQMLITSGQIHWTSRCEESLQAERQRREMRNLKRDWQAYMMFLAKQMTGKMSKVKRKKMSALITIEVHAREVISRLKQLARQGANSESFDWKKQLRFYFDEDKEQKNGRVVLEQTNTQLEYQYEYQGNPFRLVITPLTDRCYMTLTTALSLARGGSPMGPAGTGKTETVKDLAKNVAINIYVFNCSDEMSVDGLARVHKGLAQSGSWGCFDEFNRILIEVLSVIAMQIQAILNAIRDESSFFALQGEVIPLVSTVGIFITMNPGYAGRTELPENLKALFRPVAMMVPDTRLIAEVMMLSQGFKEALSLSLKMDTIYELMKMQLSKQSHYDYGLRAINAVINCALMIRARDPSMPEKLIVYTAIRNMNLSKMVAQDKQLFENLLNDAFPAVEPPKEDLGTLTSEIKNQLLVANLDPHPLMIQKIVEVYMALNTRHGNMLVGSTMSAKTMAWKILKAAQDALWEKNIEPEKYQGVEVYLLNPKSIKNSEMYGNYNYQKREWTDGILSVNMREACTSSTKLQKWIMLDGPVDTLWIESMNTVLDDNKVLTLVNGDRIALPPQVRMVFEVENLDVASPATVSRAGMVYLSEKDMGWHPYVNSWIKYGSKAIGLFKADERRRLQDGIDIKVKERPRATQDVLEGLCHKYIQNLLDFKRNCHEEVPVNETAAVRSLCTLFDSVATRSNGCDPEHKSYRKMLSMWFLYCSCWSIGAAVDEKGRDLFDRHLREIADPPYPSTAGSTVFEFFVNPSKKDWALWKMKVNKLWRPEPKTTFSNIYVPTLDTVRYQFLVNNMLREKSYPLLVGNTGTGKTCCAVNCLGAGSELEEEKCIVMTLNFSAATSSNATQQALETRMEKRQRSSLGPVGNRERLVVFIDDLNMPRKDEFGSQSPIELLKQWVDNKFWYDRAKQTKKNILGMQILAAMGPPGGARSTVSRRFQSKMHVINLTFPDWATVNYIFKTMLWSHFLMFGEEILQMAQSITQASSELFQDMVANFKPTPSKCHYVFNLRDIAKVTQGIMQISQTEIKSTSTLVALWVHESMRIFHDRLNDDRDRNLFLRIINKMLETKFDTTWRSLFSNDQVKPVFGRFLGEPDYDPNGDSDDEDFDQSAFCNQKYQDLTNSIPELRKKLMDKLMNCNDDPMASRPGNLVLFDQALRHITRICRVIAQPRGCALLIGVGGSGRQSLSKLAAYVCDFKVFQIETTQRYRQQDFYEDLKKLYIGTGVKCKPTVFLFSDTQLIEECFLEDINNILNSGEVPGLFLPDELSAVLEEIRKDAEREGRRLSQEALYNYFIERVRKNLHVLLCLSPVGSAFRNRCRMYPSLTNCCTINWFPPWPEDALTALAEKYLDDPQLLDLKLDRKILNVLPSIFCTIHVNATKFSTSMLNETKRANYITPTKYLDLVQTYKSLICEKTNHISSLASKLRNGLGKLGTTAKQVQLLEFELKEQGKIVDAESLKCEKLNVVIMEEKREAQAQRTKVEEESLKSKADVERCSKLEIRASVELGKALPALESAKAALDNLSKKAITEVKTYVTPPPMVEKVMKAVMCLMGKEPTWQSAKKEMGFANFVDRLKKYDKNNIKPAILKKIKAYRKDPNFVPEFVWKISVAAGAMCDWVCAMDLYADVYKKVKPLQDKLEGAQKELAYKQRGLRQKQEELKNVEAHIASLQADFRAAENHKNLLQERKHALELKKERALKLIDGLSGEKKRWEVSIEQYMKSKLHLPGDCALAAAFITYAGPFDAGYRENLYRSWRVALKEMPSDRFSEHSDNFICDFLSEPTRVRDWNIWGLPVESFSTENGVIVTRTCRWPLMIDPQEQAKKWIRNMHKESKLVEVKASDEDFMTIIENAIGGGRPVLLKDVTEQLPSPLDPLLSRTVFDKSNSISMNDKDLAYNPNFMLYITTKISNPHYLPETLIKTTLVNFMVKTEGLEEQLLGIVVNREKPELEQKNTQLVVSMAKNKKTLKDLEDKILILLKEADASTILDDENLINTLGTSKGTSEHVKNQIKETEETSKKINESRNQYRLAAVRASVLFFVLNDLAKIDPMYEFSLQWYNDLFKASIDDSKLAKKRSKGRQKQMTTSKRIRELNNWHTESVYKTICHSLFERHKLLFSFLICAAILKQDVKIIPEEFTFFLRGGVVLDRKKRGPNPCVDWLSEEAWDNISELDKLGSAFAGFSSSFEQQSSEWQEWYQSDMKGGLPPENLEFPGDLMTKGTECEKQFRRMLIVRCLRPDRVNYATTRFVSETMGEQYTQPPPFDLSETCKTSKPHMPVIFVLSPGSDPTQMLTDFARDKKIILTQVALGQGQAPIAEKLFNEGVTAGNWVLLANCHLSIQWLPTLEGMIMSLRDRKDVHPKFRLWLSSDPTPKFPIALLQSSIKITTEPPRGLRSIMLRMYSYIPEDKFNRMENKRGGGGLCNKPDQYRNLLFALTFFHAVLVERKKFLTLGWNIPYAFNDSDFLVCDNLLRYYLNENEETPLEALKYLIAQALYGGRVTDEIDRRLLGVYIEQYFTPNTIHVKNCPLSQNRTHYRVPPPGRYDSYIKYISSLPPPGADPPEAFGQHPNADITMQQEGAKLLLDTVMSLQPRVTGKKGQSSEAFVLGMAKQLEKRLPRPFDKDAIDKRLEKDLSPLKTVLLQEVERYNVILFTIAKSLKDLQDGIRGLIVISSELETVFESLMRNKVPSTWKKGYYSLKPLSSWMTDLNDRIKQLQTWSETGPPRVFWLSGFTFPNGFLTAILQTYARVNAAPIDTLGWEFIVQREEEKTLSGPPKDGAYIKGFYLEGAQWDVDNWYLDEPLPMQLYCEMPIIHFKPVDGKKAKDKGMYACPVYRYPIRTGPRENPSYVISVKLRLPPVTTNSMKSSPSFWIKRGTALLLSLSN